VSPVKNRRIKDTEVAMNIQNCPRCGERKLEHMSSYCFCWECGYAPSDDDKEPNIVSIKDIFKTKPNVKPRPEFLEKA